MKKKTNTCPHCGGKEFISQLNGYELYRYSKTDGKIHYVRQEYTEEPLKLFC
jgi:hypothetical protein